MTLLGLALVLIVVGVILWAAAIAAHLGWVLLVVGIILAVLSLFVDAVGGVRWPRR